ncbi:hypothetical protein BGZ98_002757 [Dissophora globulifera]|nr:hypothetical protein BGZ98_002757 [Dissophora globulifera]
MSIGPSGFQSDTAIHMIGDTTAFKNSTTIATETEISASTGTPASTTGGAVGGSIAFLCILALLYRRYARNRRLRAKTDGIIGRNDNQQDHAASSPHIVLPPPLLPPRPYPVVNFQIAATEEQQDLAQIEMQRMQLGPSPATVSTSSPVVFPRAPPPAASLPEDPSFVPSTYQHGQHLNTFAHNVAPPHQRQYFGNDDPNSHSIQSETPAGSSTMRIGLEKAPNSHSGYARSSSQVDDPYSIAEQSQLSSSTPSEKKNWDGDEHDDVAAALNSPPPPPYLANPMQLLNSPSAPMNNDSEHNSHNINRIP